jgi:hypothetical protein
MRSNTRNTHIRNLSSTALSSSPDKLQVLEGVQGIGSWQRKDCATTIAVAVGETEMEDVEARVEVVWRLEGELAEMPPLCEMRIGMDRDTRSSLGEEERDQERSEDGEEKEQEKEDVEDVVERAAPENESSDSPLRFGFGCGIESLLGMVEERRMVEENPNLGPDSPEDLEISLSYGAGLKFLEGSIGVE